MSVRLHPVLTACALVAATGLTAIALAAPAKPHPPAKTSTQRSAPAATPAPGATQSFIAGQPDTGGFLPDTTVLARVGDRVTTVRDFVRGWFNAWVPDLPAPDSAGRAQFLNSIVTKDLLALEAHRLGVQLGFEDRLEMREYTQRMLSGVLYRRAVTDSVSVSDADVDRAFEGFRTQVRSRHIQFSDPEIAERVRADLLAKRIGWEEAVRQYSRDPATRETGGDLGWMDYGNAPPVMAYDVWPLPVGVISPVFRDDSGFHLAQVTERRAATPPDLNAGRRIVASSLQSYRIARRLEALTDEIRRRVHLVYENEAIEFASRHFTANLEVDKEGLGTRMTYNDALPEFSPADTSRVLARLDGGVLTLGRFLDLYSHLNVMVRPEVYTPGLFRKAIDNFLLEPAMAEEALARGLDRDPIAVRNLGLKREQLMVQRLYQDSVAAHVWLSPKERRAFYQDHLSAYFTFPKVRFAAMSFHDRESAASVATLLKGGADVHQVLADSLKHRMIGGSIKERRQNESGPYHKLLFEGMRPGGVEIDGPARDGSWFVIKLMEYDAGRQLTYEEAAQLVDDDSQRIRGEELLEQFVVRLKQRHAATSRPELVMGIRLAED